MKRYFLLFFIYSSVFSQELPKFLPPSPTAYELGKYGEIPIGLFTGSPNVSIPLLEYKTNGLTIPITLAYSSNGIKVDELETKVGLGWVINTGGIITRTTKGGPDELRDVKHPVVVNENYKSNEFIEYYNTIIQYSALTGTQASLRYDSEPDVFNFNFLGRTGRFTFNNDGKIVLLSDFSLKITYNADGLGGFLITDEKGIKYYFNVIEQSRLDTTGDNGTSYMGAFSNTSWSISKIVMPDNDIINFNYADEVYDYITSQEQSLLSWYVNYPISNVSNDWCHYPATLPHEGPILSQRLNLKGKRITSISSTNPIYGTINFEYNITHPQVVNYSLLSAVSLKNNLNTVVEKATLNYTNVSQRMFLSQVGFLDPAKKYNFDYGNLSGFPQRLSFAKDRWGYYNGATSNLKLYSNLFTSQNSIESWFSNYFPNGANRDLDETKAKIGMLKKVIYPTRGYSEFDYESNDYSDYESISPMSTANLKIATTLQDTLYAEKSTTLILNNLAESYNGPLKISFSQNYLSQSCYSNNSVSPYDRKLFIEITNLTNPLDNQIISMQGIPYSPTSNSITITENDVNMNKYLVSLGKNNSYKIKISVFYQCLMGELSFDYPTAAAQTVISNKKTGGLRVSKVVNKESSGAFLSSKKYFYARKEYLDRSSAAIPRAPNYISHSYDSGICPNTGGQVIVYSLDYYNLNSNDLAYKYIPEFQYSRYEYVTVSEDDDQFQNGGIEYKHKLTQIQQMSPNAIVFGNFLEAFPENENSWGDGLNLETTTFKKDPSGFIILKKEINDYLRDSRINETLIGFKLQKKYDIFFSGGIVTPLYKAEYELNVTKYHITTNWNYLSQKTVQLFDVNGLNPIETVTNYFYDNPVHCQLTRTITNNSNGIPTITKTSYPDDVVTTSSLGLEALPIETFTAFTRLKTPTVSNPNALHQNGIAIQNETYSDTNKDGVANSNELLSVQRTNYKDWGTNNILPEKIQTLKGVYNASTNSLQDRIQFHSYYDDAKVKELSQEDGSHIVYIWGYNKTQPIAKIENAAYSEVSSFVANLQTLSNTGTEQNLITALNTLRTSLPNAMVTTYTYKPLIGVSTITDPKGLISYYEYDSANRLQYIKDQNLNVLQKYCYNYLGQLTDCTTGGTITTYKNVAMSLSYTKECAAGLVGSTHVYSVPAGIYFSTVSQADANAQATAEITANGQNFADANGTCLAVPEAPTGLAFTSATTTSLNFSWTAVTNATGYKIYKNGTYVNTVTTTTGSLSGLTTSTAYNVQVLAINASVNGALCTSVSMSTLVATPTGIAFTSATTTSLNFSWTAVTGATGYKIYKDGLHVSTVSTATGSLSGLTASTSYNVQVLAYNASGDGALSTAVSMSTTGASMGFYKTSGTYPTVTGSTLNGTILNTLTTPIYVYLVVTSGGAPSGGGSGSVTMNATTITTTATFTGYGQTFVSGNYIVMSPGGAAIPISGSYGGASNSQMVLAYSLSPGGALISFNTF